MEKTNFRGKCESTTGKVTKGGLPKHSGNFSAYTFRLQKCQSQDYNVVLRDSILMIDDTPLSAVLGAAIEGLLLSDPNFESYVRRGVVYHNGKEYEAEQRITKCQYNFNGTMYTYRMMVYTNSEFDFEFPNFNKR